MTHGTLYAKPFSALSTGQNGLNCILKALTTMCRYVPVKCHVLTDLATDLSNEQRAETITRLKAIVKDSRQDMISAAAMTALGALGDCAAATVLTVNRSNKLKGLLNEALGALQRCEELTPFLVKCSRVRMTTSSH